ncbi:hypothetical protein ACVBAX_13325 [Robertmurraya sp. GLU-23]
MEYWLFISSLKESSYYKFWSEYESEQDLQSFVDSINNETIEWDYNSTKRILSGTDGWWGPRGDWMSWYFLAALLSKRYIKVSVLPCKYYQKPSKEDNEEMHFLYRHTINSPRRYLNKGTLMWFMWNWLKEQGDPQPTFPSSLSNVFSEELGIAGRVGEGDPNQMLSYILPNFTFIHVPFANTPRMFVFEPAHHFNTWRKMGMMNYIVSEDILKEAQRLLDLQRGLEVAEEEMRRNEFIKSCQLHK